MASDIQSYLRELQAALAGSDPALVQDALFDAEEHLHAELAAGRAFEDIVDHYGTPAEVAAAYLETAGGEVGVVAAGAPAAPLGAGPEQEPAGPPPVAPPPAGPAPGSISGAAPTPPVAPRSAWREVFGVFVDPQVWKSLLYMLISLGTGIAYFTVVVTMLSTSLGSSILIIGLPLLLLTLALVRGMALAEGRLVEALLGTRMPRRPRSEIPGLVLPTAVVLAQRPQDLGLPGVSGADAAPGHRVLRLRGHRHRNGAGTDRRSVRGASQAEQLV